MKRLRFPSSSEIASACHCGVCRACVAHQEIEDARFARHIDPDYYRRRGAVAWESPLRGGAAVLGRPSRLPLGE